MSNYLDLVGLPYISGKQDCFSIGRRYFRENYGIKIRNYARPDRFWEDPSLDLYRMYRLEGFKPVLDDHIQLGDVLLMPLNTPFSTHACIVVDDNTILHHMPGALSCCDRLRPRWSNRAAMIIRHPVVTAANTRTPKQVHLHEVINADVFRDPEFQKATERLLGPRG